MRKVTIVRQVLIGQSSHECVDFPLGTKVFYVHERVVCYGVVIRARLRQPYSYATIRWERGLKVPIDNEIKQLNGLEIAKLKALEEI